ncbi:hypothetical protein C2S51_009039 [Perilla frutescens var. frutescens]|nr:hypothetical protein C2S51_009039 [Perilla frutescens var. frutescens]
MRASHPNISPVEIDTILDKDFPSWFAAYALDPTNNIINKFIRNLAKGSLRQVNVYHGYYVNGYKFHTLQSGSHKATMNSGVCIKGINYSTEENDFYGRLLEVVELEYPGLPISKTVLFNCEWFSPSPQGTYVHPEYKLVNVNHRRRYNKYDPFVLAKQAIQVYYSSYPSLARSSSEWWAVCKIKGRANIEVPYDALIISPPFQEDELTSFSPINIDDEDPIPMGPRGRGIRRGSSRAEHLPREPSVPASTSASASASAHASVSASAHASASAPTSHASLSAHASATASAPPTAPVSAPPLDLPLSPTADSSTQTVHRGLTRITISKNGVMMPSNTISHKITEIFKGMMHETGYTWKMLPPETKASYYEEFKKYFTWEPYLESVVHEKWGKRAATRYKDLVHNFKIKEKLEKAKRNRLSEPDGPGTGISKHKGGSRCADEHILGLAKEKGVSVEEVSTWDLFLRLHSGKDGEFTEGKSERLATEVRARVEELSQTQSTDSVEGGDIDMSSLYVDVLGRTEKRRVFGLGNISHMYFSTSGSSNTASQFNTNVIGNIENRLQSFETELR